MARDVAQYPCRVPGDHRAIWNRLGDDGTRADNGPGADRHAWQDDRAGADRRAALHERGLQRPVRRILDASLRGHRRGPPLVEEVHIVADEDLIFDRHAFADECMTLDLAARADLRALLDLDERADRCLVTDFAPVH